MPNDNDDNTNRLLEEECPGPVELESVLANDTLNDVVKLAPLTIEATALLADAIRLLQNQRRGCALVLEDGKLAGIFTERDVLMKVAGHQIDSERALVGEYMTRRPVTLSSDSSVAYALHLMVLEGFRHIPTVDAEGRPIGVVSMRDLMEYLTEFFNRDVLNLPPHPQVTSRSREGA